MHDPDSRVEYLSLFSLEGQTRDIDSVRIRSSAAEPNGCKIVLP